MRRRADETEEWGDEERDRERQKKTSKENRTPWSRQCGWRIGTNTFGGSERRRGRERTLHTHKTDAVRDSAGLNRALRRTGAVAPPQHGFCTLDVAHPTLLRSIAFRCFLIKKARKK